MWASEQQAIDYLVRVTGASPEQARAYLDQLDVVRDGRVRMADMRFAMKHRPKQPERWERGCAVYLMSKPGMLKIGISEAPDVRRAQLSTEFGERVELLAVRPHSLRHVAEIEERDLHERFEEHRLFGEWFRDVEEIRAYFSTA